MSSKYIQWAPNHLIARNTDIAQMLESNDKLREKKATAMIMKCEAELLKHWPEHLRYLLNFKIGDKHVEHRSAGTQSGDDRVHLPDASVDQGAGQAAEPLG